MPHWRQFSETSEPPGDPARAPLVALSVGLIVLCERWRTNVEDALALLRHRKASADLATAIVAAGTTVRSRGSFRFVVSCLYADTSSPPIYGWITEGFEPADLMEEKALLEELS